MVNNIINLLINLNLVSPKNFSDSIFVHFASLLLHLLYLANFILLRVLFIKRYTHSLQTWQ